MNCEEGILRRGEISDEYTEEKEIGRVGVDVDVYVY